MPNDNDRHPKVQFAMKEVLGVPAMLDGELVEQFEQLVENLRSAVKPVDFIEEMLVRDVAELSWELLRLRRFKAEIIRAKSGDGIERIFNQMDINYEVTRKWKTGWAQNHSPHRKEVIEILKQANFDEMTIFAMTMYGEIGTIETIERMISQIEARRNDLLREIERHRDVLNVRRVREAVRDVEDAEVVASLKE